MKLLQENNDNRPTMPILNEDEFWFYRDIDELYSKMDFSDVHKQLLNHYKEKKDEPNY